MSFYKNRFYFKTKNYSYLSLKEIFSNELFSYLAVVVLFGSRIDGTYNEKSDYDFAVYTSKDITNPWGELAHIWNDFSKILDLHECDYDIINLKDASVNIKNSIKEGYVLLKGTEDELQRLLSSNN